MSIAAPNTEGGKCPVLSSTLSHASKRNITLETETDKLNNQPLTETLVVNEKKKQTKQNFKKIRRKNESRCDTQSLSRTAQINEPSLTITVSTAAAATTTT